MAPLILAAGLVSALSVGGLLSFLLAFCYHNSAQQMPDVLAMLTGFAQSLLLLVLAAWQYSHVAYVRVPEMQVAVVYNTISGSGSVVQQQGLLTYIPVFQRVELLSLEPQVFVMEGDEIGPNRAPHLVVRANDGSMFEFPKLETHYQIIPEMADRVIRCYGPGNCRGFNPPEVPGVWNHNTFNVFNDIVACLD